MKFPSLKRVKQDVLYILASDQKRDILLGASPTYKHII